MSTFRDAIAMQLVGRKEVAASASHRPDNVRALYQDANSAYVMADAVLAMLEMEAIRQALFNAAIPFAVPAARLRQLGLDDDLTAWVLGGDQ